LTVLFYTNTRRLQSTVVLPSPIADNLLSTSQEICAVRERRQI
jgi:hypothetical protein